MIKRYNEFILERLNGSDSLLEIIRYLTNTKNDKIAALLTYTAHIYDDDNDINWISLAKEANMIRFIPKNRRSDKYHDNLKVISDMEDTKATSVRIGRAIKQITDVITKKHLTFEYKGPATIENLHSPVVSFDFEGNKNILYLSHPNYKLNMSDTKCIIRHNRIKYNILPTNFMTSLDKVVLNFSNYTQTNNDFDKVKSDFPESTWSEKIITPIEIELSIKNNITITPSDIEKFTNEFISLVKSSRSDENSVLDIVSGDDISYWYDLENYQGAMGKLGSSCMSGSEAARNYLEIYTKNPDKVSLLILKNKDNKLIGRALLWKTDDGGIFMDRIYTSCDSDDNIFINYAINNGYVYRNISAGNCKYFVGGKELDNYRMSVTLKNHDFEYYPYLDTLNLLCYDGALRNYRQDVNITLTNTEGRWAEYDDGYDDEYDEDEF
jgi:hypothetical protein